MNRLENLTEVERLKAQLKYTTLLVDLVIEIAAGRGDDITADNIRDDMDTLWYSLSTEQQEEVEIISGKISIFEAIVNKTIQQCPKCKQMTATPLEDKRLICHDYNCFKGRKA